MIRKGSFTVSEHLQSTVFDDNKFLPPKALSKMYKTLNEDFRPANAATLLDKASVKEGDRRDPHPKNKMLRIKNTGVMNQSRAGRLPMITSDPKGKQGKPAARFQSSKSVQKPFKPQTQGKSIQSNPPTKRQNPSKTVEIKKSMPPLRSTTKTEPRTSTSKHPPEIEKPPKPSLPPLATPKHPSVSLLESMKSRPASRDSSDRLRLAESSERKINDYIKELNRDFAGSNPDPPPLPKLSAKQAMAPEPTLEELRAPSAVTLHFPDDSPAAPSPPKPDQMSSHLQKSEKMESEFGELIQKYRTSLKGRDALRAELVAKIVSTENEPFAQLAPQFIQTVLMFSRFDVCHFGDELAEELNSRLAVVIFGILRSEKKGLFGPFARIGAVSAARGYFKPTNPVTAAEWAASAQLPDLKPATSGCLLLIDGEDLFKINSLAFKSSLQQDYLKFVGRFKAQILPEMFEQLNNVVR